MFTVSFLAIVAYREVPFGDHIIINLQHFSVPLPRFVSGIGSGSQKLFTVDHSRVRQELIYFAVAGQIWQNFEEYIIPYLSREFFSKAKEIIQHCRSDKERRINVLGKGKEKYEDARVRDL
jgi:anoctamin-10